MTRTYQVKYKSKSKMLTTPEAVEDTKKTILEVPHCLLYTSPSPRDCS